MSLISNYKKAIELSNTLDDIEYIEEKLKARIDLRKAEHRKIHNEIQNLITKKVYSPDNEIIPF